MSETEIVPQDNRKPVVVEAHSVAPGRCGRRFHWYFIAGGLIILPLACWGYFHQRVVARQQLIAKCQRLQSEQNWDQLRQSADELTKLDPSSAEPWIFKAAACEETKDFEEMVASIARVPESHPRFAELNVHKLMAEFRELNRPLDGLKTCDHVLDVNPLVMQAHEQSINFCLLTLQRAEMVRRIRRAINCRRERPEDYVFLVSASWLNHSGIYSANTYWLKSNPIEVFEVAQAIPVYLFNGKTGEKAERFVHVNVATVEEMINRYPENLELLNYLVNHYIDYGNMKAVEALLDRAPMTENAESDARFWRARSMCRDAKGELEAAAECLQKAFSCDPYWWKVHFELHQIYHRLGNQMLADRFLAIYEAGRPVAESISFANYYLTIEDKNEEYRLSNKKLLGPILKVATMVEDWAVVNAMKSRINEAVQQ